MLVAIDFGISNTDIAVLDKDETVFYSSPSKPSKINSDYIKDILKKYYLETSGHNKCFWRDSNY